MFTMGRKSFKFHQDHPKFGVYYARYSDKGKGVQNIMGE